MDREKIEGPINWKSNELGERVFERNGGNEMKEKSGNLNTVFWSSSG